LLGNKGCGKIHGDLVTEYFEMDREFAEAEDMLNRIFRTVSETDPSDLTSFPYYYGK
jgi:hypothetical protein